MKLNLNYKELTPYLAAFAVIVSGVVVGNYIFKKISSETKVAVTSPTEKGNKV